MAPPFVPVGSEPLSPQHRRPAPAELKQHLRRTQSKAAALLRSAGIDIGAQTVTVRAMVDVEGHVGDVQVLRSSGSPAVDDAAEAALRKAIASGASAGALCGAVTLRLGPAPQSSNRLA